MTMTNKAKNVISATDTGLIIKTLLPKISDKKAERR